MAIADYKSCTYYSGSFVLFFFKISKLHEHLLVTLMAIYFERNKLSNLFVTNQFHFQVISKYNTLSIG